MAPRKCSICQAEVTSSSSHYPFCSAECKNKDLGNWALESYRIAAKPESFEELEELEEALKDQ